MYQANSRHTGHLPGVTHAVPLERVWTRTFPTAVLTPPMIGSRTVFMTAANVLHALSTEDGSTRWTYQAPVGGFWSGVATLGNRVYAVNRVPDGSNDGRVVCLRASTGAVLWSQALLSEGSVAPVTVGGSHVLIHEKPCGLRFLDAQEGDLQSHCSGGDCQDPNSKSAAYLGGRAYIATANDVYYCDESGANGPVGTWGTLSGARSTPMLVQMDGPGSTDYALVVRQANALRVVKPADGDTYWSAPAMNPEDEGVASAPGAVYFFNDMQVVARQARTGAILWTYENVKPLRFSPVATDNLVYFVDTTHVHALDRLTGQLLWSAEVRKEEETGGAGLAVGEQGLVVVVADRVIWFRKRHIPVPQ
jgi:outer membrane protein assembly factor BamB